VHAPETSAARTSGDRDQTWLKRGTSGYLCIRDFEKALTNSYLRKQGANLANFMLCHQKTFVPIKFCH